MSLVCLGLIDDCSSLVGFTHRKARERAKAKEARRFDGEFLVHSQFQHIYMRNTLKFVQLFFPILILCYS